MTFLSGALRTPKRKFAAATAALLVAGTGAAVAAEIENSASFSGFMQDNYVSLDPCRIVDTRSGLGGAATPLASGETRTYTYSGKCNVIDRIDGGEGGASNYPGDINASVTAVDASNKGYLRIFRANASEPNASFMNYAPRSVFNTSNIGPIQGDDAGRNFKVKNYGGPTDLVIDVHGYWAADW